MLPRVCPWWFAYTFDHRLRRLFHKPEALLKPYVQPGMTVLDLGCGMGYFSFGLAGLVGVQGQVVSVDLQSKMLEILFERAKKAGLSDRIAPRLCRSDHLGLEEMTGRIHFALAFWMIHEVPDKDRFLKQVHTLLVPNGHLFISEPKGHVSRRAFQDLLSVAYTVGWRIIDRPQVRLSRTALLEKADPSEAGPPRTSCCSDQVPGLE